MRIFNVELNQAKLNVLKSQFESLEARVKELADKVSEVETKRNAKAVQIDELEKAIADAQQTVVAA